MTRADAAAVAAAHPGEISKASALIAVHAAMRFFSSGILTNHRYMHFSRVWLVKDFGGFVPNQRTKDGRSVNLTHLSHATAVM